MNQRREKPINYIMLDRSNLLQSSFDELSCLQDYRKTLEVQFYDEVLLLRHYLI